MVLQSKRIGRFFMIGVYDYTVIATYLSLLLGAWRPLFRRAKRASRRHAVPDARGAARCLRRRIARTKKDRTEQEKRFGIQIDSLNDLVCFGVLPAAIGWSMDCDRLWFLATMSFFALCALIRLAYFNVTEEERQDRTSENRAYYLGVPVTASAVLAPLFYLLSLHFSLNCAVVYALGLFLLGVLYITPIRVKKPQLRGVAFLSVFGLGEFAVLLRVLTR